MVDERRKYKRVLGRLRITYKIEADSIEGSAYSIDVSAGGFCIGMDQRIKNDTLVELLVYLPDNEKSFTCTARVSWQKMHGIKDKDEKLFYETGLRFENLDLKNRLRLIYYVHGKTKKMNKYDEKDKP
jgi:hypothetical protein